MLHEDYVEAGYVVKKMVGSRVNGDFYRYYALGGTLVAKTCTSCTCVKVTEDFPRHSRRGDGLGSTCKLCAKSREAALRKENPQLYSERSKTKRAKLSQRSDSQIVEDQIRIHPQGSKTCVYCQEYYPLHEFQKDRTGSDGLSSECKNCGKTRQARNRQTTKGYDSDAHKRRRRRNLERTSDQVESDRLKARPTGKKKCKKCKTVHALDVFYNDRGAKDGLGDLCKPCSNETNRTIRRAPYLAYWNSRNIPQECYLCGGPYDHVDHVIPLELEGPDEMFNMLPMCTYHNVGKRDTPLDQWLYDKYPYDMERVLRKVIFDYGVDPFPINNNPPHR